MNWVDYTIIGVLALSVLVGLWRGLVSEVLALVIWVAAFWLAWLLGPRVASLFESSVHTPAARLVLAYALCFIAVLILGALLRFVLRKLIDGTGLSGSDRMFGMLFGLARGVLVVTLAVLLIGFTPFPGDPWWHQSRLLPSFQSAATWLGARLPGDVAGYLSYAPTSPPRLLPTTLTKLPADVLGAPRPSSPAAARSVNGPP